MHFANLKTLVAMQLKDKLDFSFLKSRRSTIFKIAAILGQFLLGTAAFFVFFYLASALKIFSFSGLVPASLVTAMFSLMFVLSLITCTAGLTRSLYLSADNRVLLTLPVPSNMVFYSKFALYFIFELKKNFAFFLPMYVAYGIVCHAVWYFYPWLLVCYVFVSLLTVSLGAAISIPALFVSDFVKRQKWLQAVLIVGFTMLAAYAALYLINLIPQNINIAGRWGTISSVVQEALDVFAGWVWPLNTLNLMIIGGAAEIRSTLFTMNALWGILLTIGTVAVCLTVTYFLTRPLFFKMASKQFEFEKVVTPPKKNVAHKKGFSALLYLLKRNFRSGKYIVTQIADLLVLPAAIFFLNKTYAAMNTRLTGQYMTMAFSLLICLLLVNSENVGYASVFSVEGNARPVAKTQPISPYSLVYNLVPRAVVMVISVLAAVLLWQNVSKLSFYDATMIYLLVVFEGLAHLLWSAEMDIMNPQNGQYATLGLTYDNPNERNSTIAAFLLSAVFAFLMYFIMKEGQSKAITKITAVAFVFLIARCYLFFTRIRLYYAEK